MLTSQAILHFVKRRSESEDTFVIDGVASLHHWRYTNKQTLDLNFATSSPARVNCSKHNLLFPRLALYAPRSSSRLIFLTLALNVTPSVTKSPKDKPGPPYYDRTRNAALITTMTSTRIDYGRRERMLKLAEEAKSILSSETEQLDHPIWTPRLPWSHAKARSQN